MPSYTLFETDWGSERNIVLYILAGGLVLNTLLLVTLGCCVACFLGAICCWICKGKQRRQVPKRRQAKKKEPGDMDLEDSSIELQSKSAKPTKVPLITSKTHTAQKKKSQSHNARNQEERPMLDPRDIILDEQNRSLGVSTSATSSLSDKDSETDEESPFTLPSTLRATTHVMDVELIEQTDQARQLQQQVQQMRDNIARLQQMVHNSDNSSQYHSLLHKEREYNREVASVHSEHALSVAKEKLRTKQLLLQTFSQMDRNELMCKDILVKTKRIQELEEQRQSLIDDSQALRHQTNELHALLSNPEQPNTQRLHAMKELFAQERVQHQLMVQSLQNELKRLQNEAIGQ